MKRHTDAKVIALARVPLFADRWLEELEQVAALGDEVAVPAGTELIVEGALGHEFFVLLEGAAVVTRGGDAIRRLGPGDFFGELALLGGVPRTASVTTTEPSLLVVFDEGAFRRLARETPQVAQRLVPEVARRLAA